jgi:phosphoethanolamine N-methyltransferase
LQKAYWKEHSTEATLETMLLDTKARELDEKERPEIMGASSQNEGGAE